MQQGIGWFILGIIFLELVTMFMIATPESAERAREAEYRSTVQILGEERAQKAREFANNYFSKHFIETGLVKNVQATLVPSEEKAARANLSNFMSHWFSWVQQRLDGLWAMFYGSYHRLYVMCFMMMFCIPVLVPALIDGLNERRIAIETHEVATAVYFHGAKKVLTVMLVMPLFILFLPFTVNTELWFVWMITLPIALWVTSKNVQEL